VFASLINPHQRLGSNSGALFHALSRRKPMLVLSTTAAMERALSSPLDPDLKRLLTTRRDQLGGDIGGIARFVVMQSGDKATNLDSVLGFSVFQNPIDASFFGEPNFTPTWEWIKDHGFAFECVWIWDDSGYAYVLIVPKQKGIEPALIELCTTFASEHA
jgi:hypothetical protein